MARTLFKLRSQGQPFKMIGATQPVQPVQPPQQDPVQPLYSNPNDPQVQQQAQLQTTPMMQTGGAEGKEKKGKLSGILKGIGLGAVDMLTAGLDRVYSTGKTNTLGGSKALTFAKTKAELAEQAKKDEEALDEASITEIV